MSSSQAAAMFSRCVDFFCCCLSINNALALCSLCGDDAPINFESWCSDDISSCNPSSDTDLTQAAAARASNAADHLQQRLSMQPVLQKVEPWPAQVALQNINRSVQQQHFSPPPLSNRAPGDACFTAEDFDLDDPYHEPGEERQGLGAVGMGARGASNWLYPHQHWPMMGRLSEVPDSQPRGLGLQSYGNALPAHQQLAGFGPHGDKGEPLSGRPLERVRDAAGGLPSHISAFGDDGSGSGGGAGPAASGSVRLPSHISAFGEGMEEADPQLCEEARQAEREHMQRLYGGNHDDSALARGAGQSAVCGAMSCDL